MDNLSCPVLTTGGIFDRLDAEWAVLCADTSARTTVTGWRVTDWLAGGVAALADSPWWALGPAEVLATLEPRGDGLTVELVDAVFRTLLERAASCGRSAVLAARIIVQAMIPAAVRIARGQVRPFGGRSFDEIGHMAVVALFVVARSGRIHTRPGRPAANLTLDALGRVCRDIAAERELFGDDLAAAGEQADTVAGPDEVAHARAVRAAATAAGLEPAGPGTALEAGDARDARVELLGLVLEALESGALSLADGQAIAWHCNTAPVPDALAASHAGTTAGAWQRRRSRAVGRLKAACRPAA
ncbi:hypothetical protein [Streptomyces sp. XD-27]|uniref:hypothetical protein n=1 Tax=Streptomyces sp. XD-27 TaxID=3062779 RepID=UPI0026F40F30|nr:hypothetical protein [Streptomyces sp. XD-27]WKX74021.1 hypothetical protein Q3Y56_32855 [Streptomyces sp. XD-27]